MSTIKCDQAEDQVRFAEVAALEPLGRCTLRIANADVDADEDEHHEEVDEEREPALGTEPGQRLALCNCCDQRHHDRREQDQEPPEDERVDQTGAEPLEQLLLSEHDDGLVADPLWHVVEPAHRLPHPHEAGQQQRPAAEEQARGAEHEEERERGHGGHER